MYKKNVLLLMWFRFSSGNEVEIKQRVNQQKHDWHVVGKSGPLLLIPFTGKVEVESIYFHRYLIECRIIKMCLQKGD